MGVSETVTLINEVDNFVFKGPFYIGTAPIFTSNAFKASKHGFRGIIQYLRINEEGLIGNKTVQEVSESFDQYFNVIGWRNHECYQTFKCEKYETCLPELDSFKCNCSTSKCKSDSNLRNPIKNYVTDEHDNQLDHVSDSFSFDGRMSYVIYNAVTERITSQFSETYQFSFRTKSQNGVILWSKEDSLIDYFFVGLWNGYLHIEIELGAGVTQIFSVNTLHDGQWHDVTINRNEEWLALKVDNSPVITSYLFKGASKLDTNGLLYLGGTPAMMQSKNHITSSPASPSASEGFSGCLRSIFVDKQPVNLFTNELTKNSVVKTCN